MAQPVPLTDAEMAAYQEALVHQGGVWLVDEYGAVLPLWSDQ